MKVTKKRLTKIINEELDSYIRLKSRQRYSLLREADMSPEANEAERAFKIVKTYLGIFCDFSENLISGGEIEKLKGMLPKMVGDFEKMNPSSKKFSLSDDKLAAVEKNIDKIDDLLISLCSLIAKFKNVTLDKMADHIVNMPEIPWDKINRRGEENLDEPDPMEPEEIDQMKDKNRDILNKWIDDVVKPSLTGMRIEKLEKDIQRISSLDKRKLTFLQTMLDVEKYSAYISLIDGVSYIITGFGETLIRMDDWAQNISGSSETVLFDYNPNSKKQMAQMMSLLGKIRHLMKTIIPKGPKYWDAPARELISFLSPAGKSGGRTF